MPNQQPQLQTNSQPGTPLQNNPKHATYLNQSSGQSIQFQQGLPQRPSIQNNQLPHSGNPNPVSMTPRPPLQNQTSNQPQLQRPPLQNQQAQRPPMPPVRTNVVNPTPVQSPPPPRPTYVNPSNFEPPKQENLLPPDQLPDFVRVVDKGDPEVSYPHLEKEGNQIVINTHQVLKLVLYLIPSINVLVLMFRSIKDADVLWHSRQSALMQVIWLVILLIINTIGGPLIAGEGITLALIWNLLCIGLLVIAGGNAYLGKRWRIPIVAEVGMAFVDEKE